MKTFEAKFLSRCSACPDPVRKGQEILFTAEGSVVHASCDSAGSLPTGPVDTCEWCYIQLPASGRCGCQDD